MHGIVLDTAVMAALRLVLIVTATLGFFLLGAPLQRLIARVRPGAADRIPLLFCRSLLALARVRLDIEGPWHRRSAVMLAANHVSWIDILALGTIAPFCFLAKGEIARWPIVSAFAAVQGTVFVDRRRRRSIPPANRALATRMAQGRCVLLFPEGTTVAGPQPGRFHSSHFAAARDLLAMQPVREQVEVQPVAIAYSRADAAWIGDDALLPHLWRVLRRPALTCHIRFGAPIAYRSGSDRKLVARQAFDQVAALLALSAPIAVADGARQSSVPAALAAGC